MSRAHRARRDTSEAEIIAAYKACGYSVRKIAQRGLPDLLVWRHLTTRPETQMWFSEAKTGKGKLREGTQTWWAEEGLPVLVMRSAEDVLAWHRQQTGDRT